MNLPIIVVLVTVISFVNSQGYYPPGLQFNPYFNPQNFNATVPVKNFTAYNPYFSFIRPQAPTNANPGASNYWDFWSRVPLFSNYFNSSGQFRPRAIIGGSYAQPYHTIPEYFQCNGSHSLAFGVLTQWDKVLFRQSYLKPGRWYSARQKYVYYPGDLPIGLVRNETITAIRIQDRHCNGTGGYAQIISGGIGYRQVTLRLYSSGASKGFSFYVMIFGR